METNKCLRSQVNMIKITNDLDEEVLFVKKMTKREYK